MRKFIKKKVERICQHTKKAQYKPPLKGEGDRLGRWRGPENFKIFILYAMLFLTGLVFLVMSFGCGKEIEAPKNLILKDYGFSAEEMSGGMAQVSFGLEVENPNTDFISCNASVRITYYDAADQVIVSREEALPVIFAKTVQGYGENVSVSKMPNRAEAELVMEDAYFIPKSSCGLKEGLKIEEVNCAKADDVPVISGKVLNENTEVCGQALIFAVFKNEEGKITGGAAAMVRGLAAKSSLPFSVMVENWNESWGLFFPTHSGSESEELSPVTHSFTLTASCWNAYLPVNNTQCSPRKK